MKDEQSSRARGPLVLGINAAYHHSSAALVSATGIVAAAEEERFNRVRHGKGTDVTTTYVLPIGAIDQCLEQAGCTLADVDHIAYSFEPRVRRRHTARIASVGPVLAGGYETIEGDRRFLNLIEASPALLAAAYGLPAEQATARWVWVDHHRAHLASAYLASPFDHAAGLVIDGIGEAHTTTITHCQGLDMQLVQAIDFPHSIGFVWELMTDFLGFEGNYDECKVMGLAAWGDPERFLPSLRRLLIPAEDGTYRVDFSNHEALLHRDYGHIVRLLGGVKHRVPHQPIRFAGDRTDHADVAAALQQITGEVLLSLARLARRTTQAPNLVMAGGVALNAVANGIIARESGFDDVWIQPAASDAGTALGAALEVLHSQEHGGVAARQRMATAYLGPGFTDEQIVRVLDQHRLQYRRVDDPAAEAVDHLLAGRIVGWYQGRMEFGPRALGNRSLLADPRSTAMRQRINRHVKHRQEFRPFAPTVLVEHAAEWFEADAFPQASRFMLVTYPVREHKQTEVPAVLHVDGSSRLQLLHQDDNPTYHRLISMFHERTGVPMVLNTSLNDREPIVCTPDHAARCFLKTNIDVMIMGSYVVEGPKPWERHDRSHTILDDLRGFDDDSEVV